MKTIFCIVGPSGVGKSTVVDALLERLRYGPFLVDRIVNFTTRPPRENEVHGIDYIFLTDQEMDRLLEEEIISNYIELHGYRYCSILKSFTQAVAKDHHGIFIVTIEGYNKLRMDYPFLNWTSVFVHPGDESVLFKRLFSRYKGDAEKVRSRHDRNELEMKSMYECDHIVYNDKIDYAVDQLFQILKEYDEMTQPIVEVEDEQ